MIREWIIRLGFIAAVLSFFASLGVHLATFTGLGWAQVAPGLWRLYLVYLGFIWVAGLIAMSTHPLWTFQRKTPWWTRVRQTFAIRPAWANLLHLLNLLLLVYALWWLVADITQTSVSVASFRSITVMWIYTSLLMALSLGESGLGWWNRWVAERGGAQA
jgi:hypothetical protein